MPRGSWFRLLAHGLLAGALLSCLRVPLGLDWTQVPAPSATSACLFRAAALIALALSLGAPRPALRDASRVPWLAALALGYAALGFGAPGWLEPASRTASVLLLLVFTFLLRSLAGSKSAPDDSGEVLGRGERLGLVLIGSGTALALETVAREVRLFTLGPSSAETVVGTVFLASVCVAALAFGPLASRLGEDRLRTATGLAATAGTCLIGLGFLAKLSPEGLHAYLRRIDGHSAWLRVLDEKLGGALGLAAIPGLDGASIGTLWTTVLLAAASFVAPAFVLGATLGSLKNIGRLAHALVGGALGLVLLPYLIRSLSRPLAAQEIHGASWSWTLLVAAAGIAGLGLLALSWIGSGGKQRWPGSVLALGVALLPWVRPRLVLWSFSPWSASPIEPELVVPIAEGMITVERSRDGERIVTLDRRRLTPILEEQEVDERRLRLSWSLLAENVRQGTVRGLFVGQVTPARARVLRALGQLELDRTAPWHAAMPAVEGLLFQGEEPPPGRLIPPAEARAKLADEGYDWVIVPPVHGAILLWKTEARELWGSADAPRLDHLRLDGDAVGVVWVLADSPLAREAPGDRVLLAMTRFEALAAGVVRGRIAPDGPPLLPPLFPTGEPSSSPSPLELLRTLPQQRSYLNEAAWTSRLERASAGGALAELSRGLALHFGAQQLSSPYEMRAMQLEVAEEGLRAFLAALPERGPLDDFTREIWESLAWLLTEKRMPEEALVYLEPVAERFAPWPILDRALGRAYREVLEPEAALRFFERALGREPYDIDLLAESSACAGELGDPARALAFAERARKIQPGREDLERLYGLALLRAGDERGRGILEPLLARDPEDSELRSALEGPPAPSEGPAVLPGEVPTDAAEEGSAESGNANGGTGD